MSASLHAAAANILADLLVASLQQNDSSTDEDEPLPIKIRIIPPSNAQVDTAAFNSFDTTPPLFKKRSFISPPNGHRHVPTQDTIEGFIKFCMEDLFASVDFYREITKDMHSPVHFVYGVNSKCPTKIMRAFLEDVEFPTIEFQFELLLDTGSGMHHLHSRGSFFKTLYHLQAHKPTILDLVIQILTRRLVTADKSKEPESTPQPNPKTVDENISSDLVILSTSQHEDSDSVSSSESYPAPKRLFKPYLTQDSIDEDDNDVNMEDDDVVKDNHSSNEHESFKCGKYCCSLLY